MLVALYILIATMFIGSVAVTIALGCIAKRLKDIWLEELNVLDTHRRLKEITENISNSVFDLKVFSYRIWKMIEEDREKNKEKKTNTAKKNKEGG
jgi:spermidine synthase